MSAESITVSASSNVIVLAVRPQLSFGAEAMALLCPSTPKPLLSKLANGEPDDSILQWLNSFQGQKIMKGPQHHFTTVQMGLSSLWATLLKSKGRSALESQLKFTPEQQFPHLALKGGLQ
jgi:hypothetical protein